MIHPLYYQEKQKQERLLSVRNIPSEMYNGIFTRYQHPVLTAAHVPVEWQYDLSAVTNPFFMKRLCINACFNAGAIKLNGKFENWDGICQAGLGWFMAQVHAPGWLIATVATGAGAAIQTVMTFLPPVGFMFLALSVLEDSGYMARAAFVMDRFMRGIGLPGKSFVPMLVGFGCSVPAIMATRTLESKRDRFLTVFMTPFMSCGAKLPIWVLFGAAFFPQNPGKLIFLIYITGIVLGITTGLILKHTLFQGDPTHFIMELPPYHCPRLQHIFLHTWERLKIFIWRAGKFIVPMVLCLGILNTIGTDGTIGHEDTQESVLAAVGKTITPVFEPIGVEHDNWPAAVSVFTGLFAKESVIGTLNGLYSQSAADEKCPVGEGWGGDFDGHRTAKTEELAGRAELRRHFPKGFHQAFAYLLFILLYVPCIGATAVVFKEIGRFYGAIFVGYQTLLGWSVATIYHSVMVSGRLVWGAVGVGILVTMFGIFRFAGSSRMAD